ncbi:MULTISPECIES: hypothetical protein [Pectobacterium]|uniref:hypothetical protein n=1 Tax=Pectobacterium TaxID=122277 RepID=UPI000F6344CF|nr:MULTISPECIES: hypothetical protein [Pectobacterium]MBQ4775242.1 hypothetical protein [Pectobacterium versatile]RRO02373.1 hypothetical protein DMB83_010215 [Pectobacterium aquaticum]
MSVLPNDFLVIAESPQLASDEMKLRNSISRAYYSGYLHAKQKVGDSKIPLPQTTGGVHHRLISSFSNGTCGSLCGGLSNDTQSKIAGFLNLGKQLRTKADYRLEVSMKETDRATSIALAKEVVRLLP